MNNKNQFRNIEKMTSLEIFAFTVLQILEEEKDWNADMLDEISLAATNLGLADIDTDSGFFRQSDR